MDHAGGMVAIEGLQALTDPRAAARAVLESALAAGQAPPDPRLQTTPWTDLKTLHAEEFSYLHSYGWVDKDAGVAHMPIDKAKALLLQKGLPVRPGPVDAVEGTSFAATGESSGGRNLPASRDDASQVRARQKPGGGS